MGIGGRRDATRNDSATGPCPGQMMRSVLVCGKDHCLCSDIESNMCECINKDCDMVVACYLSAADKTVACACLLVISTNGFATRLDVENSLATGPPGSRSSGK